jgi:amino acid transporter
MVVFEDSVNMAGGNQGPVPQRPEGYSCLGLFNHRCSILRPWSHISAITLVPPEALCEGETPAFSKVVAAGAPNFPLWRLRGLHHHVSRGEQLRSSTCWMASRLGLRHEPRGPSLPKILGAVHRDPGDAYVADRLHVAPRLRLITFVGGGAALGGTTALLLLCVFTVVNVAVLVLRRDPVAHEHFRTPTFLPIVGAASCAFLVGPWTGRDPAQYRIAGVLLGIGVVLWVVTMIVNRATGVKAERHPLDTLGSRGPVN